MWFLLQLVAYCDVHFVFIGLLVNVFQHDQHLRQLIVAFYFSLGINVAVNGELYVVILYKHLRCKRDAVY